MKRVRVLAVPVAAAILLAGVAQLASAGVVDITDNRVVDQAPDFETAQSWAQTYAGLIAAGRNAGEWNGAFGLISSTANADFNNNGFELTGIGLVVNGQLTSLIGANYAMFGGVTTTDNSVLMKYTYVGDVNLDGKIDADDLGLMENGYFFQDPMDPTTINYLNGDLNYDGLINADDFQILENNYFFQFDPINPETMGAAAAAGAPSAVPEPGTLALLAGALVGIAVFVGRRVRGQRS